MTFSNRVTKLFNIDTPLVQAGMVWASGWRLASAVSNAGALGLIGSGSMYPDVLKEHILKCRSATGRSFGVNVPLLYPDIDKHIQIVIDEGVKIVFTSAGNPKTWTPLFKRNGITVVHVVSSSKFALKKLTPVRLMKNKFFQQVQEAESRGADEIELREILGRARAKKGMHEGN